MQTIYVLDRLLNKPVRVQGEDIEKHAPKTRIVYRDEKGKEMVGSIIGCKVPSEKGGNFLYPLTGEQEKNFDNYQEKATDLFDIFKKEFLQEFPDAIAIAARMNLTGNQVYFYFYADTRFNFADFVKRFRQKIGYHFFLYQVGARDRVRFHPHLEERYDPSGLPLMYHIFRHPLPGVEGETISLQGLQGRDADRLKDRSGKLDHTLSFEKDIYLEETQKYPPKGAIITLEGKRMKCIGFNILTQEIKLRGENIEKDRQRNGGKVKKDRKNGGKTEDNKLDKKTNERKSPAQQERFRRTGEFKTITLAELEKSRDKKADYIPPSFGRRDKRRPTRRTAKRPTPTTS